MAATAPPAIGCHGDAHAFSALHPDWTPHPSTPCDCDAVSWEQYQRILGNRWDAWRKRMLQQAAEHRLAFEGARRKKTLPPFGPDPRVCNAPGAGGVCGGEMGPLMKGRHSGWWMRICSVCGEAAGTQSPPPGVANRGPIGRLRTGDLSFDDDEPTAAPATTGRLERVSTIASRTSVTHDARTRQLPEGDR